MEAEDSVPHYDAPYLTANYYILLQIHAILILTFDNNELDY